MGVNGGLTKGWKLLKRFWQFVWNDDSLLSWAVAFILAFVLIKFLIYPGLGLILATSHPIVAVVSSSMEHNENFETWWGNSSKWYEDNDITKADFETFSMKNGFNKGDLMILRGKKPADIQVGEILVFQSHKTKPTAEPIIHRVVAKQKKDGSYVFQTKGDNYKTNPASINACGPEGCIDETNINEQQIIGVAWLNIPCLGYAKIWFVELINTLKGIL